MVDSGRGGFFFCSDRLAVYFMVDRSHGLHDKWWQLLIVATDTGLEVLYSLYVGSIVLLYVGTTRRLLSFLLVLHSGEYSPVNEFVYNRTQSHLIFTDLLCVFLTAATACRRAFNI